MKKLRHKFSAKIHATEPLGNTPRPPRPCPPPKCVRTRMHTTTEAPTHKQTHKHNTHAGTQQDRDLKSVHRHGIRCILRDSPPTHQLLHTRTSRTCACTHTHHTSHITHTDTHTHTKREREGHRCNDPEDPQSTKRRRAGHRGSMVPPPSCPPPPPGRTPHNSSPEFWFNQPKVFFGAFSACDFRLISHRSWAK